MKHVLFVDDEQAVLDGLRNVLRTERRRWRMEFALGGEDALRTLEAFPADVVVSDMRMPGIDGVRLLEQVRARHPDAVRIVLSGHADLGTVAKAHSVAHRYLVKPCEAETVRAHIERACELQDLLASPDLRRLVGSLGSLPAAPRIYDALTRALEDPDVDVKQLAGLVNRDVAVSSRVLQLVNSAYYGLAQRVTSIETAIVYLGANTLRHLALSLEVFSSCRGLDVPTGSLEALERHALLTGRTARRILGPDRGDEAFAAGLLHDAGKLVFLRSAPREFAAAVERSAAEGIPLWRAEREVLGATHAELGGYLLGLWGIPHSIVEPVAFHHSRERILPGSIDAVAAVAAADRLAQEAAGEEDAGGAGGSDDVLGSFAAGSISAWRELAAREAANLAS